MGDGEQDDPDRAAILARRRRFIALAISGLATAGCKRSPEPCLSISVPDDEAGDDEAGEQSGLDGPIVEDPGVPLEAGETGETGDGETGEAEGGEEPVSEPAPHPCLKIVQPRPQPCLKKVAPKVCLFMSD